MQVARRIIVVTLLLLSAIGVLLGNPSAKIFWLIIGVIVVVWEVRTTKPKTQKPKATQEPNTTIDPTSVKTKPIRKKRLRRVLLILGWVLVAVLMLATNQALSERDKLKGQLAAQTDPTINRSLVLEDPQLAYVNAVRAKHGVPPLRYDDGLLASATAKTQDMIDRHYWSHETPEGESFYEAQARIRPGLGYYGENIAQCFRDHKMMYVEYENSPGHLENMINPKFTLFGGSTQWDKKAQCYKNTNHFGG